MLTYIIEINKEGISTKSIRMDILLYIADIDEKLNLTVSRTGKIQQEKYISNMYTTLTNPI